MGSRKTSHYPLQTLIFLCNSLATSSSLDIIGIRAQLYAPKALSLAGKEKALHGLSEQWRDIGPACLGLCSGFLT